MGMDTKIGLFGMGLGVVTGTVGLALVIGNYSGDHSNVNVNDDNANIGGYMFIAGGVVVLLGGLIAIDGAIGDHKRNKHRISIITPKNNGLGIAYNF